MNWVMRATAVGAVRSGSAVRTSSASRLPYATWLEILYPSKALLVVGGWAKAGFDQPRCAAIQHMVTPDWGSYVCPRL